MQIGILGPLVVELDGREVAVGAAKQRAVLALLVVRRNEVVPIDTLVDEIWDGRPPATATKIIHGYVSQLRKVLGSGVPETLAGGYRLRIAREDLDVTRFEVLLQQGRDALAGADPVAAAAFLREALALWRGPPLAEFRPHEFAADEADRLEEVHLLALECRLEADIALGNHAAAIPELQLLIREHPLRESLRRLHMLALYRAGRQADALAAYRGARTVLVETLGIEPSDDLQQIEAAILNHDPALDLPRVVARPLPGSGRPSLGPPADPARAVGQTPRSSPTDLDTSPRSTRRHSRRVVALAACAALLTAGVVELPHQGAVGTGTDVSPDYLGFVTARANTVGIRVAMTGAPIAVAVDGPVIWAVEPTARTLTRIDARSDTVVQTTPVGRDPSGVAVSRASVWVTNHDDNTVSRINAQTNAVVETVAVGAGPVAVAEGYGSVWVTNGDDRTLSRIDETSGAVTATIHTNAVGRGITVGGGSVWVTDEATDRIIGVDPSTNSVTAAAMVGNGPTGIAYGNGSIWVVNALDGTVSRLDTARLAVESTIPVSGGPVAISVGADAVWVGTEVDSQLVRIDAAHGTIVGSTSLGSRPEGLAATDAGVWVAAQGAGAGHRGGRLVVIGGVDSIDPSVGEIGPEPLDLAYDALTSLRYTGGSAGTQIVPDLAASLPQPTAGGKSYTFHLRPAIRYSDGQPLQAADFRRGLQRLLQLNQSSASYFSHVVGAVECSGRPVCDLTAGVQAEGTSTITFRLSSKDPRFLEDLSFLVPIPAGTPMRAVRTAPVPGTGPYAIQSFVPEHLLTFERNRYFEVWSQAARPDGYPDEIVYRNDADEDDAVRQVVAGKADLVQFVGGPAELSQVAAGHPGQVHTEAQQATVFLFLNTHRAPFDDVRVRRAVNYAVDRQRVAELYGAALSRPTCQIIPPTTTGYRQYCPYTIEPDTRGQWRAPDLAKAQALVDSSGNKGQQVVLWTFPDFVDEAKYLSGVLNQLGYPTSVHEVADASAYFDALDHRPDAQAGMYGWFGNPLAVDTLSTLTCSFAPNPAHFCNARIDAQVRHLADIEPSDPDAARNLAAELDREITDEAPWAPLLTPQSVDVTSARVGNYQAERGRLLLDQLWVK